MNFLKTLFLTFVLNFITLIHGHAQDILQDSSQVLVPIEVQAYFSKQALLKLTSSTTVITKKTINTQATTSVISAINSTPGVRMEERSPGSYRIALRGSMIRSPFGVRNSKIYLDEIPFTDASGNTYFNLLDPVGINGIQIIKGPDGSLFGANSAGVIRIQPNGLEEPNSAKSLLVSGGSFGQFHEQLSINHQVSPTYSFSFDQAFLRSDGYRQQTGLSKKFFQTAQQWQYKPSSKLKALLFYSDLGYETPGGLTQEQYEQNPKQARPAAGKLPSAIEQKAAIYNKTVLAGIIHEYQLNSKLKHVISVFGTNTDFKNPFITNFEVKKEQNLGYRTYVSFQQDHEDDFKWQMQLGTEGQQGWYNIKNYQNNLGQAGDLTDDDHLKLFQHFYFYRFNSQIKERLTLEASLGLNYNNLSFDRRPIQKDHVLGEKNFGHSWMPRLGFSYLIFQEFAIRGSTSKGYSPPTIAEVRSSDNQINENLNPETGTNYELGLRFEGLNRQLILDVSAYKYLMKNGIIRQLHENGSEYFVNAGKIDQKGIEASLLAHLIKNKDGEFWRNLIFSSNVSYQYYRFKDYQVSGNNYAGNAVTSIPRWIWVNTFSFGFKHDLDLNLYHNFTSSIPLNDANSVYSSKYHLIQAKISWTKDLGKLQKLQFFIRGDNLLNEKYALGNDINAVGNRFFNASPTRNYYAGMKLIL